LRSPALTLNGERMMDAENPERTLAISYAPVEVRPALSALFALDDALAALVRTTREPAIAQIRLAWWREQLAALDRSPPPAMPTLQSVAAHLVPRGISGTALVSIVEGWEVLIEAENLDDRASADHAALRGGGIFAAGEAVVSDAVSRKAGEGWALADLSRHLEDPAEAERARLLALDRLMGQSKWSRNTRTFGALAAIASMNLRARADTPLPIGSPRRVARLAWMRLTGR